MLGTEERLTYLDSLKPPQGYRLDQAIATTFSLDLLALLVVPLSLARFEVDDPTEAVRDPIILLETLRTHSKRLTVFCQQGQIHVPPVNNLLLSYLEPIVFEARARNPGGVFHAKTWLLRFLESDGGNAEHGAGHLISTPSPVPAALFVVPDTHFDNGHA